VLRLAGCLVGAVIAILAMLLVEPHIQTLAGLLCMSLPVIALSAWVGAGSDKSAYGGTQMMFCFALTLLADFGPIYDLTLVRDRIVGIVLGVIITTFIQTLIWPEHERDELRKQLVELLRNLAQRTQQLPTTAAPASMRLDRLESWNRIAACEAVLTRVQLEAGARDEAYVALRDYAEAAVEGGRRIVSVTNAIDLLQRFGTPVQAPSQVQLLQLTGLLASILEDTATRLQDAGAPQTSDTALAAAQADSVLQALHGIQDEATGAHVIARLEQLKVEVLALQR